jgi:hypothetical protein
MLHPLPLGTGGEFRYTLNKFKKTVKLKIRRDK